MEPAIKGKLLLLAASILLLGFPIFLFAHGIGEAEPEFSVKQPIDYLPIDPFQLAIYDFALILILVVISLVYPNLLTDNLKKAFFLIIAIPVILITVYASLSTVYLNITSDSKGPVHWHADFEIFACGEKITNLPKPVFPANYVGTSTLHHHDDFRLHVEGLVIRKEDISLRSFFHVIGGSISKDEIRLPLDGGSFINYKNGDLCPDGKAGELKLYKRNWATNDQWVEIPEIDDYVLLPEFNVPSKDLACKEYCGDYLRIAFETK